MRRSVEKGSRAGRAQVGTGRPLGSAVTRSAKSATSPIVASLSSSLNVSCLASGTISSAKSSPAKRCTAGWATAIGTSWSTSPWM